MAARLLLLVVALAASFGAAEIAARFAGYEPIYAVYSKPSQFWQADWLLGWSHEPGAEGPYVGPRPYPIEFETTVRINSQGLRGPEIAPRPEGGYRILLLGDSFVVGFEVEFEQTFSYLLAGLLQERFDFPVQTIDAGVRGYGTDQSLLYFRERGWRLEPDMVVFVHSNNDWTDNVTLHRARRPFGKPAFALREDGRTDLVGSPVPEYPPCREVRLDDAFDPVDYGSWIDSSWCHFRMGAADHSALFSLVTERLMRIRAVSDFVIHAAIPNPLGVADAHADEGVPGAAERLTGALITDLAREVRRRGAEFVLVMNRAQSARLPDGLLASVRITPRVVRLEGRREELVWKYDSHLTPTGHRNYAKGLADIVAEQMRATRGAEPEGG